MENFASIIAAVKEDGVIGGTTQDGAILRKAQAAWAEMEVYCGQPLVASAGNVVYRKPRGFMTCNRVMSLPFFPIQEVVSFTYRTEIGGDLVTVDAGNYSLTGSDLYYPSGLAWNYGWWEITLTVGANDIPPDVHEVCVELVLHALGRTRIQSIGNSSIGIQQRGESNPATGTATTVYKDERRAILERLAGYKVPII